MNARKRTAPRVLMLGSECAFSAIVLERLLEHDVDVCGLVLHAPQPPAIEPPGRALPVVVSGMAQSVALDGQVPVTAIRMMRDEQALAQLAALQADIVLVACFPLILDRAWTSLAGDLCLNLHPSLLPSYRGPVPLFWQLRAGERETGATLHVVDDRVDAGEVVAQHAMPLAAGTRLAELNAELAETGAELTLDLLDRRRAGVDVPRTRQDETTASYQPFPRETDLRFDTHFTAERAYRFIRGIGGGGTRFELDAGDALFVIEDALDFHDTARMAAPYEIEGERVRVRCSEGVLEAIGQIQ